MPKMPLRLPPPRSPVRELPVLTRYGIPIGGGSYQRLLPGAVVSAAVGGYALNTMSTCTQTMTQAAVRAGSNEPAAIWVFRPAP